MGNNQECCVEGIGSVQVRMFDNQVRIITYVRYVPDLRRSLISLGMFDKGGYVCKTENDTMKIVKGVMVKLKGKLTNGLYLLQVNALLGTAAIASSQDQKKAKLWHMRLGHASEKGLKELKKQGLSGDCEIGTLDNCEHCIYGKTTWVSFSKRKHISRGILDYVHANLWGPEKTSTLGGAHYFLSIVDDFSRRVWVYLLKNKAENYTKFVEWKTLVKKKLKGK